MLPLAGLKVVDLSSGPAGGLATMILADFGARVERVVDPEFDYLNRIPSARMWLRGKQTCSDLAGRIETADVLVVSVPNGFTGVDYDRCRTVNPSLVFCEIATDVDDSGLPPLESVVAARAGRMKSMEGIVRKPGPLYAAVPVATHSTAQNAVSGILAALYRRLRDGRGRKVSTSLMQGLIPYDQGASLAAQVDPEFTVPDPHSLMPTLNYHPVQCSDGKWLQLGNLLPHLFQRFMMVIGLESLIHELPEKTEEVRDEILKTMQTKTSREWMELFIEDGGVAAHPYQSSQEALRDPDLIANGHVVRLGDTLQLGPVANLLHTPARVTWQAKPAGGRSWTVGEQGRGNGDALPLEGILVLELATIIAAPLATSFLADMGARVIKVEPPGGDPYRNMAGGIGAARCNQGKESICIDLKTRAGRDIVMDLAVRADLLIHNYRPGVPERLGIDYETLRESNPGLIYVSANGYGPKGPGARRPSTHPIPGAAMGGAAYQAGGLEEKRLSLPELREVARRLMRANEVNPDPNTSMVILTASMLGLMARELSGKGQPVFVDMFGANAWANFDDMVSFPGKPQRPPLDPELRGVHPLSRLYQTSQGWVFLDLKTRWHWQEFCRIMEPGLLEEFPAGPEADAEALSRRLSRLFLTGSAEEWEARCQTSRIVCVVADRETLPEFFLRHCHPGSVLMTRVSNETYGDYYRHGPMVTFSPGKPRPGGSGAAGSAGRDILAELGHDREVIENWYSEGVLWSTTDRAG